ncbi:lysostaphin resistance A-like protein [Halobaculum sp. MBLA0147]|uniref:CPBP family intramembrane glutamic endopeptidase n=1 Tax=Halobaculum sp. MBLA0147 TaxID=3079934 RepID=UPI003523769D
MSVRTADPQDVVLRVIRSLFVLVAAWTAAFAVVAPVDGLATILGVAPDTAVYEVTRTVAQFVGFALACVAFLYYAEERDLVSVRRPSRREAGLIVGGLVGLLAVQFALLFGLQALGIGTGQNRAITAAGRTPVYFLLMIPVSLLVVGPAEELLFRGVVQGHVRDAVGAPGGIAFASLLFGAIHLPGVMGGLPAQVAYVGVATVLGAILGVLYERTDNVVVPSLTHGGYNAVLFGIQYATVIGVLG